MIRLLEWLVLVCVLIAIASWSLCAGETAPAGAAQPLSEPITPGVNVRAICGNMLPNSSFEDGRSEPNDWGWFGLAAGAWEFGGRDGGRCITITGDGADAGWWYAKRWVPVEHNQLYRITYWARGEGRLDRTNTFIGLDSCEMPIALSPEWQQHEFCFRSSDYLSGTKFRIGQRGFRGEVLFDDFSLMPAVAVHRSVGRGGGLTLGDGEKIMGPRYSAIHDLATRHSGEVRFLQSYTAERHGDRWVLDDVDEIVYRHEIRKIGVADLEMTMKASNALSVDTVMNDPRAESGLLQKPAEIEVEVAQYQNLLLVQVSQDGKSWRNAGTITKAGTHTFDLTPVARNAYEQWIRLKCMGIGRTEVTCYKYESTMINDLRTNDSGATHYIATLYCDPEVKVRVMDLGDLAMDGRSEVKLLITPQKRVWLECRVAIETDCNEITSQCADDWTAPGSQCRMQIPYVISDALPHTLRITGKDKNSGRLLFLLEGPIEPLNPDKRS